MEQNGSDKNNQQRIFDVLKNDFRSIRVRQDLKKEFRDLSEFYLNDEQKERLNTMSYWGSRFYKMGWLFRSIFLYLTPFRRILVLVGILIIMFGPSQISDDNGNRVLFSNGFLGGIVILFVLGLELKDKLVMQNELDAGRKIQKALMPDINPQFPGWEIWLYSSPANDVAGDLVDFLRLDETKAGISIADVAGKGLQAALLTTKLQATIRALPMTSNSLSEFCSQLNIIFHRDSPSKLFASMIYSEITSDSGNIRYVNAGHFPPLIISATGIVEEAKGGPALGIMPKATFSEQTINLADGEIYLAYSDGIVEAQNENGSFYGKERFMKLIDKYKTQPINDFGATIINQIQWFAGEAAQSDDISLILMRRKNT